MSENLSTTTVLETRDSFHGNVMPRNDCYFQYQDFQAIKDSCDPIKNLKVIIPHVDDSKMNSTWFHGLCTKHAIPRGLGDWFAPYDNKHELIPLTSENDYRCPCLSMEQIPNSLTYMYSECADVSSPDSFHKNIVDLPSILNPLWEKSANGKARGSE